MFNGQNSVLWNNVRDAFPVEIVQMYQTLRSNGTLSYANVNQRFIDHQAKWPESVFNEDAWFKYIDPLVSPDPGKDPTAVYLPMLQGSKAEQRKWWLYNRFRYMDSKWNAGDALSDIIQIRGYAKADITVTPYADIYPTIKYGSYLVAERGHRNEPTLLPCPLDAVNDTEIYIYSASQLSSIGDLSPLKVGFADFSKATRLQSVKVGSGDEGYVNQNLTELSVGNSRLLQSVDARNCAALTGSVNLSGAANIKTVLLQGTAVSSVLLPVGGMLQTLRLPSTIANLTIRDQTYITLFSIEGGNYGAITTLRIENCGSAIPIFDILEAMLDGSRVRILGMSTAIPTIEEVIELYDRFDVMSGLDENGNNIDKAVVSGKITGVAVARRRQLLDLAKRYPNVTIECVYVKEGSIVRFYNGDTLLQYIDNAPNNATAKYTGPTPVHPTNPAANEFIGWYPSNINIYDETNCYAQYHDTESLVVKYIEDRLTDFDSDGLDKIRPQAFDYSTGLKTVTLRGSTEIGIYAFRFTNLDMLSLVDLETLPSYAFYNATIKNVGTFRVDTVENGAFVYATFGDVTASIGTLETNAFTSSSGEALRISVTSVSKRVLYAALFKVIDITCPVGALDNEALDSCKTPVALIRCDGFAFASDSAKIELGSSAIGCDDGALYVPDDQVSLYKSKRYAGYYADRAHPTVLSIDQYPVNDMSTIADSWADIVAASKDGTYATRYKVGDKKLLEFSDGKHAYMHLVAMDADELSDGTGTAHMTWLMGDVIPYKHAMISSSTDISVGWAGSGLREYLSNTIAGMIPQVIMDAVKVVRKRSQCFDADRVAFRQDTDDALWIPSATELWATGIDLEAGSPKYGDVISATYPGGGAMYNGESYSIAHTWTRTVIHWTQRGSDDAIQNYYEFRQYRAPNYTYTDKSTNDEIMLGFCL